jgi:sodium-dependent dicarboxylate transporter 2/3/5
MGPITRKEIMSLVIILGAVVFMSLQVTIPALQKLDKTAIILVATVLFFVLNILDIEDLELIPWNIVLLFSGAMSIGFCLWKTGAAEWMAVNWLAMFKSANWLVFVLSVAFMVMMLTNFIMNVAAIAISIPVALVIAKYLGVDPHVVMYSSLVTAGMPFLLLVGAAPNAIAYDSKQFTSGEFFKYGCIASVILMLVVALACYVIWPILGMPILLKP